MFRFFGMIIVLIMLLPWIIIKGTIKELVNTFCEMFDVLVTDYNI